MLCVMLGLQMAVQGTGTNSTQAYASNGAPRLTGAAAADAWAQQPSQKTSVVMNGSMRIMASSKG